MTRSFFLTKLTYCSRQYEAPPIGQRYGRHGIYGRFALRVAARQWPQWILRQYSCATTRRHQRDGHHGRCGRFVLICRTRMASVSTRTVSNPCLSLPVWFSRHIWAVTAIVAMGGWRVYTVSGSSVFRVRRVSLRLIWGNPQ